MGIHVAGPEGVVEVAFVAQVFPEGVRIDVVHKEGVLFIKRVLPLRTGLCRQERVQKFLEELLVEARRAPAFHGESPEDHTHG